MTAGNQQAARAGEYLTNSTRQGHRGMIGGGVLVSPVFALMIAIAILGCQESSKVVEQEPDPKRDLQPILDEIAERCAKPVRYLTGGVKRVEMIYSEPKFDIRKTDSIVTPLVAIVEVARTERIWLNREPPKGSNIPDDSDQKFMSYADAMKAKFYWDHWVRAKKAIYHWDGKEWHPEEGREYPFVEGNPFPNDCKPY